MNTKQWDELEKELFSLICSFGEITTLEEIRGQLRTTLALFRRSDLEDEWMEDDRVRVLAEAAGILE